MKKTLAVATFAALVGVAGAANAADLYKGGSLKDAPAPYVPVSTWTGFYIGAHVGGFWADIKNNDANDYYYNYYESGTRGYGWDNTADGVFGGGTVGYNYQTGSFVFGVEADFGGAGLTNNWNDGVVAGSSGNLWAKNDASFYADVTGRLGYAAGPALFYAKGGWAFLDDKMSVGGWGRLSDGTWGDWSKNSNGLNGWVVGGGIEYLWSPNWSVKAEYLYFDFSRDCLSWTDYYGTKYDFNRDLTVNSFKVGINYHFANAYAPLK
jgi:outer membrane immunogenic protein